MIIGFPRIPLVPRRPGSPDGAGGKGKDAKAKPKGKDLGDEYPAPADQDEKLVYDGLLVAIQAVEKIVSLILTHAGCFRL